MILKPTIYVDVLVAVNFFINYFLLLACAKFLSVPAKRWRFAVASGLGAFFSLSIFLPEFPAWATVMIKLLMSAAIVLCAFGFHSWKQFLRNTAAFYLINFGFAGLMLALWYFLAPQGLMIRNSIVYFDISPVLLIILTVICYLIITLVCRITGRQMPKELFCRITIHSGGISCTCNARVDTGNSLREPFSNYPVIVVSRSVIERMLPKSNSTGLRLIPFGAVSGSGLLKAFRPDLVIIFYGKKIIEIHKVYIAVSESKLENCDALLNPDILQASG